MSTPDQTINLPQLLLILILGGLAVRYFFFSSTSTLPRGGSSSSRAAREADVERVQQMFPQIPRRDIMWDLQRNGGNMVATTERILSGRGLEVVRPFHLLPSSHPNPTLSSPISLPFTYLQPVMRLTNVSPAPAIIPTATTSLVLEHHPINQRLFQHCIIHKQNQPARPNNPLQSPIPPVLPPVLRNPHKRRPLLRQHHHHPVQYQQVEIQILVDEQIRAPGPAREAQKRDDIVRAEEDGGEDCRGGSAGIE